MAQQPKKSTGTKSTKSTTSEKPQTEAPEVAVTVTDSDADTSTDSEQEKAPEAVPTRSAAEWEGQSRTVLNVKPSILRLTLAGHAEGRKYTEDEIRRLIQRKLGEPA